MACINAAFLLKALILPAEPKVFLSHLCKAFISSTCQTNNCCLHRCSAYTGSAGKYLLIYNNMIF